MFTTTLLTSSRGLFGLGNWHEKGIQIFERTHKCNIVCQKMKFKPIAITSANTGEVRIEAEQIDCETKEPE